MRVRPILLFVFLLAFARREAVCRDFSASVGKSGEVVSSNGVLRAVRYSPGHYEVTFESPINECRVSGTIGQDHTSGDAAEIVTGPGHSGASAVSVETRTPSGTPADFSFRLNVKCPEPQAPPARECWIRRQAPLRGRGYRLITSRRPKLQSKCPRYQRGTGSRPRCVDTRSLESFHESLWRQHTCRSHLRRGNLK